MKGQSPNSSKETISPNILPLVTHLTKIGKKGQSLLFQKNNDIHIIEDNNLKEMPGPAF